MAKSFADVLGAFKPREKRVVLVSDGPLLAEHEALSAELQEAMAATRTSLADGSTVQDLAARIQELEPLIEASRVTFVLRGLGWNAYQALVAEHTNDDGELVTDTFAPLLVAKCSADPKMDPEQVGQLAEILTQGEFAKLYYASVEASVEVDGVPFSRLASAVTQSSGEK